MVIAVVIIVAVVIALFEQFVVPRQQQIRESGWGFFSWAWRTVVRVVTVFVTVTRVVFKIILQRVIKFETKMGTTIKWVRR